MAGKTVGSLVINVSAGTADLIVGLNKANASIVDFQHKLERAGERGVSEMRATSAAAKVIEGNILSSSRAMDAFIETVLHAGPLMQKIFPLIGGVAFVGILTEGGKKLYEFFKSIQEGPAKVTARFNTLNGSLNLSNAELAVTQQRLQNDLAILAGRQPNTLKLALLEAAAAADKLGESLDKDLKTLNETIAKQGVGAFVGFFTNQGSTGDLEDRGKKLAEDIGELRLKWEAKITAAATAGDKQSADAYRIGYQGALDARFAQERRAIDQLRKDTEEAAKPHLETVHGRGVNAGEDFQVEKPGLNEGNRLARLTGYANALTGYQQSVGVQTNVAGLTEQKAIVEAQKKSQEVVLRLQEELNKAVEKQLTPLQTLNREHEHEIASMRLKGEITKETIPWMREIYTAKWVDVFLDGLKKANEESVKFQQLWREVDKSSTDRNKQLSESWKNYFETLGALGKVRDEISKETATNAAKVAGIAGDRGDPVATARAEYAIKEAEIRERYASAIATAAGDERALVLAQQELELTKARLPVEEAIAKVRAATNNKVDAFKIELETLAREKAQLDGIKVTESNAADVARVRRENEDAVLKVLVQQELAQRTAGAGMRAFFLEMQQQAKSPATILYDTMNSALDKLSDAFSRLATRQKVEWGKLFQELAQSMLKESIKSEMQQGLGSLGKLLHLDLGGKKPTGTPGDPIWVRLVGLTGGSGVPGVSAPIGGKGGIFSGKDPLSDLIFHAMPGIADTAATTGQSNRSGTGFLGMLLQSLIPRAEGGSVTAGSAYLVGERGPEPFFPQQSGTIMSNTSAQRTFGGGGNNHYYTIDARGTDPVQTEMRVRQAIIAAHGSAVTTAILAVNDIKRRQPASNN